VPDSISDSGKGLARTFRDDQAGVLLPVRIMLIQFPSASGGLGYTTYRREMTPKNGVSNGPDESFVDGNKPAFALHCKSEIETVVSAAVSVYQ
jgi:hypothetical protein